MFWKSGKGKKMVSSFWKKTLRQVRLWSEVANGGRTASSLITDGLERTQSMSVLHLVGKWTTCSKPQVSANVLNLDRLPTISTSKVFELYHVFVTQRTWGFWERKNDWKKCSLFTILRELNNTHLIWSYGQCEKSFPGLVYETIRKCVLICRVIQPVPWKLYLDFSAVPAF